MSQNENHAKRNEKEKNNIPESCLLVFEDIMIHYDGDERDIKFANAMEEYLTQEQRFTVWAQNGGCRGTERDKERKAFAAEHIDMPVCHKPVHYVLKCQ